MKGSSSSAATATDTEDSIMDRKEVLSKLLLEQPIDLHRLHAISRLHGGFFDNSIRNRVWPKLVGVDRYRIPDYRIYIIDNHKDYNQVKCDIDRSLWTYQHVLQWADPLLDVRRKSLSNIIMAIVSRNPQFNYFQGLHDIVGVFMLIFQEDYLTFAVAESVCLHFFADCLQPDFEIVGKSMHVIMDIIQHTDGQLYAFLQQTDIAPFFATSWVITWFAHDVKDLNKIARIFDAMLCSQPVYSMYLCAAYVLHNKEAILSCECDFAVLHNMIVNMPKKLGIPFEDIMKQADMLINQIPIGRIIKRNKELNALNSNNAVAYFRQLPYPRFCDPDWHLLSDLRLRKRSISDSHSNTRWGYGYSNIHEQTRSSIGSNAKKTYTWINTKILNDLWIVAILGGFILYASSSSQ